MYVTGPSVGQTAKQQSQSSNQSGTGDLDSTFTQLLVAQLKSQDPLNPMDPTQFVSQLVGLNTLDTVTQIYQLLQGYAGVTSGSQQSSGGN
jgi:flagellar basal-body rod modification protein FlgD